MSLGFLRAQVPFMRARGYQVHAIASPGPELEEFGRVTTVPVHAVPMTRTISPLRDLQSLWQLWRVLRRIRPDIVHAHFAKSGLLGMIAARIAGVPARVYHQRCLNYIAYSGFRRALLMSAERVTCLLADRVFSVSRSNRTLAVDERICSNAKIKVLVSGSGQGVDGARFRPAAEATRLATRAAHGIPRDATVIGFVGRLVRDKGLVELGSAWRLLRDQDPRLHLLLVGAIEKLRSEETLPAQLLAELHEDPRVHFTGAVRDMPAYYAGMDVVALPTHREGFPNVALEAAAMELPFVTTAVPGCVDAVEDGVTGTLVPAGDAAALASALQRYVSEPELRTEHGRAGRLRVLADYRPEAIYEALESEYRALLASSA
jgi:glycosyltransferase involved in cell wall biosynthesis